MFGRKKRSKNKTAIYGALFLGTVFCFIGCKSKPAGGVMTPALTPTGAVREDLPTVSPTGTISNAPTKPVTGTVKPSLKPEPTDGTEPTLPIGETMTPTPTGEAEATTAPHPTLAPEATAVPEPTKDPELEPTGIPEDDVTPTPDPTEEPGGDGEVTPTPTETPEPTPIPTEAPDFIQNLPKADEEPVDTELLLQSGWQYTEDFFGEAKIYFSGRFRASQITADEQGYRCRYSDPADSSILLLFEGLPEADLAELLLKLKEQGAELVRYEKNEFGYRMISEGKEILGRIYSCRNKAVMRIELQYNAEDETSANVFYLR